MKKIYLIPLVIILLALTLLLSGCKGNSVDLDDMYIATFEVNGGKLNTGTTDITTKIHYAYDPGSTILDPTVLTGTGDVPNKLGYKISRSGYDFTGWYTGAECLPEQKWDFATDKIETKSLVLYAGWEKQIVYSFTVCYTEGDETFTLGTYKVKAGEVFEDYRDYAGKQRPDHTPMGFYADASLETPWDFATVHPGGDADMDIKVYVDYIPGKWVFVGSYEELVKNIDSMGNLVGNIYLTGDIDCGGETLSLGSYTGVFEGNNYSVKNFVVEGTASALAPTVSIFKSLVDGDLKDDKAPEVRNVSFENVTFNYSVPATAKTIRAAAITANGSGCRITNVSVSGKIVTDYEGELPRLNEAVFNESDTVTVTDFTSNIVIEITSSSEEA